jgi:hypothetical protein
MRTNVYLKIHLKNINKFIKLILRLNPNYADAYYN